ncbi:hypothetical protein D3C74_347310 [compost metagenome]
MKTWNTLGLLDACKEVLPGYITELSRDSMLQIPAVSDAVRTGIERDGSNTGFLYVDQLSWEPGKKRLPGKTPAVLTVGAKQAETIGKLLRGRLHKGKALTLASQSLQIIFEPGEETGYEAVEDKVSLKLDTAVTSELSQLLAPKEDIISLSSFKGMNIRIVKTYIKDQAGNVVSEIG